MLAAVVALATAAAARKAVAARGTVLAGTGNVHGDLAALKILVMKLRDGFLGFFRGAEFHKGKTPRTAAWAK